MENSQVPTSKPINLRQAQAIQAYQPTLENIFHCSKMLWKETDHQGLAKSFAKLLVQNFGIMEVSIFAAYEFSESTLRISEVSAGGGDEEPDWGQRITLDGVKRGKLESFLLQLAKNMDQEENDRPNFDDSPLIWTDGYTSLQIVTIPSLRPRFFFIAWKPIEAAREPLHYLESQLLSEANWLKRLDRAQAMLYRDDLTGLFNYRYLELALDSEVRRAERFQTPFCLMFIDIDNFKGVNDNFGHLVGSKVLKELASVLKREIREIDSVIRYGGDEFIVILLGATTQIGTVVAERIREAIETNQFQTDRPGITLQITASIGVASFPEHGITKDLLIRSADMSMYQGKKIGKNRVIVANDLENRA